LNDGALFNNQAGATFNANASSAPFFINTSGPAGTFANAGTFNNAPGGGNTTQVNALFNNTGTVNASSGTLLLDGGGSDTAGTFFVPAAGALNFGGGVTALASAVGSSTNKAAGTLAFTGGTTTVTGAVTDTGNFTIAISGGTADFENTTDSVPYLDLTGGTLTGSAALTVTATTGTALTWNGGTMSGSGSTTLASGATMSLGSDNTTETLDGWTFTNQGTVNWLDGTSDLSLNDGALFNNEGTFNDNVNVNNSNTQYILTSGAAGTFANSGTFNHAPSTFNVIQIAALFNNTGTVNVSSGQLFLEGGGTSTGSWVVSGGTLIFNGGVANLNAPSTSVTGAGAVFVDAGEVDFGGTYSVTGNTTINGGIANFLNGGSTGTFGNGGGTVDLASGTTFTVTSGNYTQSIGGGTSLSVTYLNGGTLAVSSGNEVNIQPGTYLYGPGTINGNLYNAGYLYVGGGDAPGTLTVNGNYTQTSLGTLTVQIDGSGAGQYDQLVVSGTGNSASLDGTLSVTLGGGYSSPPSGTTFTIMTYPSETGDFSTKNLGGLSSGSPGSTSYVLTA
jgi:hypothetical protein